MSRLVDRISGRGRRVLWAAPLVAVCLLGLSGCSHWRESYLNDSLNEATEEQIKQKLGRPHMVKESLLDGEAVWTYRFALTERELHPLSPGSMGKGAMDLGNSAAALIGKGQEGPIETVNCYRYELKFDRSKILREWTREEC